MFPRPLQAARSCLLAVTVAPLLLVGCETTLPVKTVIHSRAVTPDGEARYALGTCTSHDDDFGKEACRLLRNFVQYELLSNDLDAGSEAEANQLISLEVIDYRSVEYGSRVALQVLAGGLVGNLAAGSDRIDVLVEVQDRDLDNKTSFTLSADQMGGFVPDEVYSRVAEEIVNTISAGAAE